MPGGEIIEKKDLPSPVSESDAKKMENIPDADLAKSLDDRNIKEPNIPPQTSPDTETPPPPPPTDIDPLSLDMNTNTINSKEYTNQTYENDKNDLFVTIKNWRYFTKEILGMSDPLSVKTRAINHNQIIAENKLLVGMKLDELQNELQQRNAILLEQWGRWTSYMKKMISIKENDIARYEKRYDLRNNKKEIDIPNFMKRFITEQDKLRTYTETSTTFHTITTENTPIKIDTTPQTQAVGEFIQLSITDQNIIKIQLNKAIQLNQEIVDFEMIGKSDGTRPRNSEILWNQIRSSLQNLMWKWFSMDLIERVELANGKTVSATEFLSNTEDENNLNKWWAYARALMQIDFLDAEQLKLIAESQHFKVKIEAQTVGNKDKVWNQYTWWEISIKTKGSEKIEKVKDTTTIEKKKPLDGNLEMAKMYFPIQITTTWNPNDPWVIEMKFENGKINIIGGGRSYYDEMFTFTDFKRKKWSIDVVDGTGTPRNTPIINLPLDENDIPREKEFFKNNWSTKLNGKTVDRINMQKFLTSLSTYIDNYPKNPEAFIQLLEKFLEKTDSVRQKEYVKYIIWTIKAYQEVSQGKI